VRNNHGDHAVQFLAKDQIIAINYPVQTYPEKVTALNLDKTPQVAGTLLGIKGQYLLLDSGVLNIRKYSGYKIRLHIRD
jgi:hypothetical protein